MGTIVVTGSASGLGAALRHRLENEGHRVVGIDRHDAEVVADLGTPEGRARTVAAALEMSGGHLEGVVSCAGLGPYDEAKAITRVNYFGAMAVLDGLRDALAAGQAPAAVAISSIGGAFADLEIPEYIAACHEGDEKRALELIDGRDGTIAYTNAKRALAQACRRRAADWGAAGVRLNVVAPGKMLTPMLDRLLAEEAHAPAIEAMPVPLGRAGPAEEVAGAVCFLLGPDASYVHGHILFVDGGSHAIVAPDQV